jgi:hypothetical protein
VLRALDDGSKATSGLVAAAVGVALVGRFADQRAPRDAELIRFESAVSGALSRLAPRLVMVVRLTTILTTIQVCPV